jgi:dTMP kinase
MSVFITIEGPDGSGKTSVANKLIQELQTRGIPVLYTREPGGSEIAEEIRQVILDCKNTAMDVRTEALLYAASRRQHLTEKILPALAKGQIVISDRFLDSSLAYQGHGRAIGIEAVLNINLFATEGKLPDLTLYFDVSAEVGLARINHDRKREVNRLDLEKVDFHNKVREGYLLLVDQFPKRIVKIDASRDFNSVYQEAYRIIQTFLQGKNLWR